MHLSGLNLAILAVWVEAAFGRAVPLGSASRVGEYPHAFLRVHV